MTELAVNSPKGVVLLTEAETLAVRYAAEPEPLTIPPSGLDGAPDCMRRWAAGRLRKEIQVAGWELRDRRRNIAAGVGIAVHAAGKYMLDEKLSSGSLPPLSTTEDVAVGAVHEEIARGVMFDKQFTQTPHIAEIQVRRMSKSYWHHVAPKVEPIAVEERITIPIPGTRQPLVLSGQPDVVAVEPKAVRDLKATIKPGNHNCQVGAYSLIERTRDREIDHGIIDWIPRIPIKRLAAMGQPHPVERKLDIALCEQMAMDVIHDIDRALTRWREGDPERGMLPGDPRAFPANKNSNLCREQYCPAHSCGRHGFCQEWRKDA